MISPLDFIKLMIPILSCFAVILLCLKARTKKDKERLIRLSSRVHDSMNQLNLMEIGLENANEK